MKTSTFRYLFISALLVQIAVFSAVQAAIDDLIVQTESGKVEGALVDGFDVISWKGIPYAAPPTGDRRWKKPEDAASWEGVREASEYGSRCLQRSGSEDCLYLNVWSPVDDSPGNSGGLLPVFFYVHGGSNTGGSGEASWYTVAHHYNAVVVSINYRVGAMGWFSHPALKTGDLVDDSGNYGLLDQVKALQWVQDNIEQFGGDPDNVTIAGASAGAQNVSYLMHTHLAANLFHKAIMESNYPGIRPVSAATKSSKQVLYNLLDGDGSANTVAKAKDLADSMSDDEIRDYFYSKSGAEIRASYNNSYWGSINWGDFDRDDIVSGNSGMPSPVVQRADNRPEFVYTIGDGYVLPNDIDFADFSEGHVFPKPIVVGTTLNENNAWNAWWPFNFRQNASLDTLVNEALTGGAPWWLVKFLKRYGDHSAEEFMANYKFGTELIDELDMYLGAQLLARNQSIADPSMPVYVYRFDWGSDPDKDYAIPFQDAWTFYIGAPHVAEYNFFWQKFSGPGDDSPGNYEYTDENLAGRQKLSSATKSYLADFIHNKSGEIGHNSGQPVQWQPWTASNEQFIVFDADRDTLDVKMNSTDIYRTPQELYDAHLAHPNEFVRDFIEYYVMWSWHYNWYPNSSVPPFDTSPGPNALFDPLDP
jgi:para-nitrobenzyl esterase